jgi:hypothetical protein
MKNYIRTDKLIKELSNEPKNEKKKELFNYGNNLETN